MPPGKTVSTDDEEIASVAKQYGASVPFMRDAALANDYAGTAVVALAWYNRKHRGEMVA